MSENTDIVFYFDFTSCNTTGVFVRKMKRITEQSADKNEDVLSDEEMRSYASLIAEAYPSPKRSIKDSVMAEIRGTKNTATDIIISKKTKRRKLFVRYGSLAACLAIVVLVGIGVLPRLTDRIAVSTDSAVGSAAEAYAAETEQYEDEKIAETSATVTESADDSAGNGKGSAILKNYSLSLFTPVHGSAVIEDEETADVPQGDDIPEEDEEGALLYDTSENADMAGYGLSVGASLMTESYTRYVYIPTVSCVHSSVFRNSYHDIPKKLINAVGEDEFNAWAFSLTEDGKCTVNIVSFYRYFANEIDTFAEEFAEFAAGDGAYYCDIPDISLFEDGKWDEIEEYYIGGGSYDESVGDYFEYRFKTALITEIGVSSYTGWLANNGMKNVSDWSISDAVGAFDISRERLEEMYDKVKTDFESEFDTVPFTYDFDKIVSNTVSNGLSGRECDAEYRIY